MDYNIQIIDLPHKVNGLSCQNEDGTYSIFLNARATHEQRMKTYLHELQHILRGDFNRDIDVNACEQETRA